MRARTVGRRSSMLTAIVALVAVLAMFTPASAAQSFVVAGPGNASSLVYYTPLVVLQKGQALTFVNLDFAPHDVRSGTPGAPTGKFQSALISIGKKTPVVGAKGLKKGSYKFYCSLHQTMRGTLRVI